MARDTILIVDDDSDLRQVIGLYLSAGLGWRVLEADGVESATDTLRVEIGRVAVIISDDHMGGYGKNGADLFLQRSVELYIHRIPFVLLSGTDSQEFLETAESFGMIPARKPIKLDALGALLEKIIVTMPLSLKARTSEL